ncbi:unnamed protein product, partial [Amoebophrya sp. A25]|eukprot:GSA25T00020227001.1
MWFVELLLVFCSAPHAAAVQLKAAGALRTFLRTSTDGLLLPTVNTLLNRLAVCNADVLGCTPETQLRLLGTFVGQGIALATTVRLLQEAEFLGAVAAGLGNDGA